eukprot:scaffold4656_cov117-Isochrysis_galbana.AAC.13
MRHGQHDAGWGWGASSLRARVGMPLWAPHAECTSKRARARWAPFVCTRYLSPSPLGLCSRQLFGDVYAGACGWRAIAFVECLPVSRRLATS